MKDLEKLEDLLKEFKECLEDGDFEKFEEKKKEQNQKNIKDATKKIKEYLEEETDAIIYLNNERCVTVGTKNDILSLFACLVDSFRAKLSTDEIVHAFVGGLALGEGMDLNKDKVNEIMESLKKYL